ncbi:GGDEF domain-containing protein [Xanthomonas sacchari]|uniref:diguanylate cyclase n=1 Tax=Xanthomonas sacchari TaxID=56458 RepID=A0A2P5YZU5_9XANT|nr:GGDEF domain-containing protein [Xanthomonas sacchari]MDV0440381.1 GGDEF domain-containing protein [Xanthomonas sacchari]PPU80517.1 GGDEF domain-containing protein [Xanthomonas sacchari]
MEWIAHLAHAGTLLIVNALLAAVSSAMFLALYVTGRKERHARSLLLLALSYGVFALGFGILLAPAWNVTNFWVNHIGNVILDVATMLTLVAVNAYLRRPLLQWTLLLPVALLCALELYSLYYANHDHRIMVIFGGMVRGLLTAATAVALWRYADSVVRSAARFTAVCHFLWAGMVGLRIAWWALHPDADTSYDPTTNFGLLSRIVLTASITPGFLWMLTREMNAELRRHASQDPLTGVTNRRVMWERGEAATHDAARRQASIAVLMIDVDHFKAINDRFGHAIGDQVLVAIAQTLAQHIHTPNLLARIGGEEFMVLMPHGDEAQVRDLAERLRRRIEQQQIDAAAEASPVCTVSIGYCLSPRAQAPWQTLVLAADQALYAAKRAGRNRIAGTIVA